MKIFTGEIIKCFLAAEGTPAKRAFLLRLYENLGKLTAEEVIIVLDSCFFGAGAGVSWNEQPPRRGTWELMNMLLIRR